jgi:prefoldin subunit 5
MIRRRTIEVFSLSFLDCLCCGFGAILLIFLLTIGTGHSASTESQPDLESLQAQLQALEESLRDNRNALEAAQNSEQIAEQMQTLQAQLKELQLREEQLENEIKSRTANLSKAEAEAAKARRLLESFPFEDLPPIGLPSDATHVVFVVDTSGSMRNQFTQQIHGAVIQQLSSILDSLPSVQRIQFIDTSGQYILPNSVWMPDTPSVRRDALQRLRNYAILSVSDPEPGLRAVFRGLAKSVKNSEHMSVYVVGDDFRGNTQGFLHKLDRMNPRDPKTGERAASINAIGFPTIQGPFLIGGLQGNNRFANIMREIAEAHQGVLILRPGI